MAKVLIVDENSTHSRPMTTLLENEGHTLRQARNGTEALDLITREKPDVVITDILTPTMDGYEFVRRLRSSAEIAHTPIIFCTPPFRERDARDLATECGVEHVLVTTCDLQALVQAIDSCLGVRNDEPAPASRDFDHEYLRLLMGEVSGQADKLTAANLRLNALIEVAVQLASVTEPSHLIEEFCRSARQLISAKYAIVVLSPAEWDVPEGLTVVGVDRDSIQWRTPETHLAVAKLLDGKSSARLRNAQGHPEALGFPADYPDFYSLLAVPILSNGFTYGWLALFHRLGAVEFSQEDERLAEILGNLAGRIYENAGLYVLAQRHSRQLRQELTERRDAEEELRRAKETAEGASRAAQDASERLNLALKGSHTGVWSRDVANDHVEWDERICKMFGLPPESFRGTSADILSTIHPDDHETLKASIMGTGRKNQDIPDEFRVLWPDGSQHYIESRGQAFYDPTGRMTRCTGVCRDITNERQLEEQFRQAQKMEAVGQLAGGIAHDFNNMLNVIMGQVYLVGSKLGEGDPSSYRLERIRKAAERAAALTHQLLAFSRKQVLQPQVINLRNLIDEADQMVRRVIPETIEIVTSIDPDLAPVKVDPSQMQQVLLNLAINARDAMPEGGTLTVVAMNVALDDLEASCFQAPAGDYVMLVVGDNGTGMSPDVQAHVFEPFFTTKEVGKGTGLGLAMVYGTITQSGGRILLDSQMGVGTTFKIIFPRIDEPVERPAKPPKRRTPRGEGTILVVEDDSSLREVIQEVLDSAGYNVLMTSNGEGALSLAKQYPGPIGLVLSDIVLPRMTGREMAEALTKDRPTTKILFMSGYTAEAISQQGILDKHVNFISKPWSPEQLCEKIRVVLNNPSPIRRILIVDDEEEALSWLTDVLGSAGYQTVTARHGREARAKFKEQPIDLLITDLVMPEEEGIEMIRAIRQDYPELKIIAISGAFGDPMLEIAKRLGSHATFAKPLQPQALLEAINGVFEGHLS